MIDFDDVLTDPDLTQPCVLVHGVCALDESGYARVLETTRETITASVQPASQATVFADEGERIVGGIDVYTTSPISVAAGSDAADVIEWAGSQYRVTNVNEWQNVYGKFYKAFAEKVQP